MATFTTTWKLDDLQRLLASGLAMRKGVDVIAALNGIYADELQKSWITYAAANRQDAFKVCMAIRREANAEIKAGGSNSIELQSCHIMAFLMACDLYNLDTSKNAIAVGWTGCSAMAALKSPCVMGKAPKGTLQKTRERFASILQGLSLGDSEGVLSLKDLIQHYATEALSSEEHLSAKFETWRAMLLVAPKESRFQKEMFWTLHDCLKQSMETLNNRKLVEFFANEMRNLTLNDEVQEDDIIKVTRPRDLRKAEQFLSGTSEISALAKNSESLAEALSKAEVLVREQPKSFLAHMSLASVCDKLGDYPRAFGEYYAAILLNPESEKAQTSAIWALYRTIDEALKKGWNPNSAILLPTSQKEPLKDALKEEREREKDGQEDSVTNCIVEGFDLVNCCSAVPKPSVAYSQYLRIYAKLVKAAGENIQERLAIEFLHFVHQWDISNFAEEDYEPFIPKDNPGKSFPSLVETVVGLLYKCAKQKDTSDGPARVIGHEWILDFIRAAIERYPSQEWFPYYYGKLLVESGESVKAREYIAKVTRKKTAQFWTWQLLAETFREDREKFFACLCRAALCPAKDSSYLVGVHEMLADAFIEMGKIPEALCELRIVKEIRTAKKWSLYQLRRKKDELLKNKLVKIKTVPDGPDGEKIRFRFTTDPAPTKSNEGVYHEFAAKADEIVFAGQPCINAVVMTCYVDKERNEKIAKLYADFGNVTEVRVEARKFPVLVSATPGMPVKIWTEEVDTRPRVLKIEKREDGVSWDIYPKQIAILSYQDKRRGHSEFTIGNNGETCSGDWEKLPCLAAMPCGTVCELALERNAKNGKQYILAVIKSMCEGIPSFGMAYSGILNRPEGRNYGFVRCRTGEAKDIFVPQGIVQDLVGGTEVRGVAVKSYDKLKERVGWKAVTLEAVK